jgi:DNA ligase-1
VFKPIYDQFKIGETMTVITEPMLAGTCEDKSKIKYPAAATPKLDGIRCLGRDGVAESRKFKKIPNTYIKTELEKVFRLETSKNFDGEIMSGATFQECTGNVMREDGEPDFKYFIFDLVGEDLTEPYESRMKNLAALEIKDPRFVKVLPVIVKNEDELNAFEEKCLAEGYEGVMIRSLSSPYKCGRSTVREGYLLKIKRFSDSEAEILGFEELQRNNNVAVKNRVGRSERSTRKKNMSPGNTLGKILVRDIKTKVEFRIGSGFDDTTRKLIWENQSEWLGKIIKYKYFSVGVKEAPRFPTFLGERSKDDM